MRRFIIYFCCLLFVGNIYGANYVCKSEFNLNNGLPNNGVTALLQDSRGYIWVGTYDGLVRYNGHSFSTFTNSIESKIFQSNRIRSLFENSNSEIWIGTDFGVTIYDYKTGQFNNLESGLDNEENQECIIRNIMSSEDQSQIYCLTERTGVLIYDNEGILLRNLTVDRDAIFQDAIHIIDEKYLFTSNKGVLLYDFQTSEDKVVYKIDGAANFIGTFSRLDDSTILYGSTNGIKKITYNLSDSIDKFEVQAGYDYTDSGVKALNVDEQGDLWVGSLSQGLFYLEDALNNWGKPLERLTPPMRIAAFLSPYSGSMWVATFDRGLLKYNQDSRYFKNLDMSTLGVKPIRSVQLLSYDDNHILYQNSYQNISLYDLRDGKQKPLPFSMSATEMKNLQYIAKLQNGDIWFFMSDGEHSWRLICRNNSRSLIRIDDNIMDDFLYEFPYTITEDYRGYLWIGNHGGLNRITIGKGDQIEAINSIDEHKLSQKHKIEKVNSIYPDSMTNSIWFGTSSRGLFNIRYDNSESIANASIKNYCANLSDKSAISSNFVSHITRCNDILWVATEQGGLCRVDESGEELIFTPYGTGDGLSSNSVKRVLSDNNGCIWLSTNFGLSKYDPLQDRFMIYHSEQGVMYDEFTYKALSMGDRVIFASTNNICYFKPSDLPQSSPAPQLEFTDFKIFGDVVEPTKIFNDRIILDRSLEDGGSVRLKYDENVISIGIDAIYKDDSHDNYIKYRLLPLSSKWVSIPYDAQEITLSGIQHGRYTLEVVTSDFFRQKSDTKHLSIEITPPFWLSIWAYILYALLIIGASAIILYVITHMQRLRYRLHIEQVNKHNAEVLNAEKLRYFSNISHEIKTPLTLIVAPLSLLLERFIVDVDVRSKLNTIKRQSDKIVSLIDLVQGIQLSDSNMLKRNDSLFSFNDFITNIIDDFNLTATYDSKTFVVESPDENILVEADSEMLEKIVNNLISNAFKYTRSGESIKLCYGVDGDKLTLTVEDSGYGIDSADIDHIFERFFRAKQRGSANVGGTGIGLYFSKTLVELHNGVINVKSEVNKGTMFTVSMPIVKGVEAVDSERNKIVENYKEQVLGELTIEKISSESEFKDALVYIVEDNSEMRQFISSTISKFFCVKAFANGLECYEAMNTQWPDIVISDVMMPVMDGYELCETLKSEIKTSHIPVILLTACSTVDDKIKGLRYGADAYIPKPFYPNHMITRIETLLMGRKQLRERFQINIPIVYGETSSTRARDNDFLDRLYQIFSDNLDNEELDIDQVVQEFGINRNLLYQKVKAITNSSPRELLLAYRLKCAADYLQSGDKNVSEACDLTGFKSRTHFSRLFKEKYGLSPSQYSKSTKGE